MGRIAQVAPGARLTFLGCMWDAGWEFDAPCVIYSPVKRYGFGGNSSRIGEMVDDVCLNLADGVAVESGWDRHALREFKWRRWSRRGFARRRNAWHVEIVVEFLRDPEGMVHWRVVSKRERFGRRGLWEEKER